MAIYKTATLNLGGSDIQFCGGIHYGTSSTGATTSTKTVWISTITSETLENGTLIYIRFNNPNTATGTLQLNVSSTGAKVVYIAGTTIAGALTGYWAAGQVVPFYYFSGAWYMMVPRRADATAYGVVQLSTSTTSTSQTTAATSSAVKAVKDAIPTVPTTVSSFTNDAGYLTLATLPIWDGSVI